MQHRVVCGDYKMILDTATPRQAALDALSLWDCKTSKPRLSSFISVTDTNKTVFLCAYTIIQELRDGESKDNDC